MRMTFFEEIAAIIILAVLGSLFYIVALYTALYTAYNNSRDRAGTEVSEIKKCRIACAKDSGNNLSDCLLRCDIINHK